MTKLFLKFLYDINCLQKDEFNLHVGKIDDDNETIKWLVAYYKGLGLPREPEPGKEMAKSIYDS